jgi:protein TonB
MFEILVESKPKQERTISETAISVVCHALLALATIQATRGGLAVVEDSIIQVPDFVLDQPPPPPRVPADEAARRVVIPVVPPPTAFRTVLPPIALPTEIPPVNLKEVFERRLISGRGIGDSVVGGIVGTPRSMLDPIVGTESFTVDQVDDPAEYIGGSEVVYPVGMKMAGITGVVRLQFVVGVDGKVEPTTVRVVSSSHEAFERSATDGIRAMRFKPAKLRGQPVRQLVEQSIRFRLD